MEPAIVQAVQVEPFVIVGMKKIITFRAKL